MLCGGYGTDKEANSEIQAICDEMKGAVEEKLGQKFADVFEAVSYQTQVVAGTNFMIKVHIGNNNHVNIVVYKTLPHAGETLSLTSAEYQT